MGGIAIAFARTAPSADGALLDRMLDAIAHRGPSVTRMCEGPVALGQRSTHALAGHVTLVMDGYLDAELVVQSYLTHGEDFARHLVGDFALALWDARERALFLARDVFGARPLHYYVDRDVFVAGSELVQVLESPAIVRRPNEGLVGALLAGYDGTAEETLYTDVLRLEPAHTLRIDARSVRKRRYWSPANVPSVRHRDDAAYAEHFADVFRQAVKSTLRAPGPVALDLSGGLDSSSIVAVARDLEAAGETPPLITFSYVYPGEPHDESAWSRMVVERWPGEHHELLGTPRPASEADEQARWFRDLPNPPNSTTHEQLASRRAHGATVRIAGLGGDELLDPLYPLSVAIAQLRAGEVRSLRKWPAALQHQAVLRAMVPEATLTHVRRALRPAFIPPWIDDAFARRIDLRERVERARYPVAGFAASERRRPFLDAARIRATEQEERIAARHGVELRMPFTYRPLIELVLGLPPDQLLRPPENKVVLRNAMRGLLPEPLRARTDKALFGGLYRDELARIETGGLALERAGWIRSERLGNTENSAAELLHVRWIAYSLDKWLRVSF